MSRLLHISDLHFGAEDRDALAWFAAEADRMQPDAIVVTGDLTQRAKHREFDAARDYLARLPAPIIVEEGNHDLPYFDLIERFTRPYARIDRVKRAVETRVELDDCVFVSLKTTARAQWRLNWSHGHVDEKSISRAEAALREVPEEKLAIVAAHHPLVERAGFESKGKTRGGKDAMQRIAVAGCDVILTGHVHTPFDLEQLGVRMIGAGTLSERLREHPPSYNEILIRGRDVSVEHHVQKD